MTCFATGRSSVLMTISAAGCLVFSAAAHASDGPCPAPIDFELTAAGENYADLGNVLLLARRLDLTRAGTYALQRVRWPKTSAGGPGDALTLQEQVEALERDRISDTLRRYDHNRTHTAKALGLSRQGLLKKMERYGLG